MAHPDRYFRNNVAGTLNLLEVMRERGVGQLVFSSSCATYGHPRHVPITEDERQAPVNPYGESKLMSERMIAWYARAYGLAATALRYFNAAGADPEGELGERHRAGDPPDSARHRAALGRVPHLEIYGTDYADPRRDRGAGLRARRGPGRGPRAGARATGTRRRDAGLQRRRRPGRVGAGGGGHGRARGGQDGPAGGGSPPSGRSTRAPGGGRQGGARARLAPRRSGLDHIVQSAWTWHTRHEGHGGPRTGPPKPPALVAPAAEPGALRLDTPTG